MDEKKISAEEEIIASSEKKKKVTGRERYSRSRIIIGIVLIVVAILVGIVVLGVFTPKENGAKILVAKEDIPAGVVFTAENVITYFKSREEADGVQAELCVKESQVTQMVGLSLIEPVAKDEDILRSNIFRNADTVGGGQIPEGKQVAGVKVPLAFAEAGYIIKAGDIISFYGTTERVEGVPLDYYLDSFGLVHEANVDHAFVYDLLTYVKVYGVYDETGIEISGTHEVAPVTLNVICTAEQAKQLAEMQKENSKSNGYYLTIASSGNKLREDALLAEQDVILEKYKLYETMYTEIKKDSMYIPFASFADGAYIPVAGDAIRIRYTTNGEEEIIDEKGNIIKKSLVSLHNPQMLACIKLTDVYNMEGTSSYLAAEGEGNSSIGGVSLELCKEQKELIVQLLKEGRGLYIEKVSEPLDEQYQLVDAAIRLNAFNGDIPSFEPVRPMPVVEEENED